MMDEDTDKNLNEPISSSRTINLAHLPPIAQATTGAIGSACSNALLYPLDLVSRS